MFRKNILRGGMEKFPGKSFVCAEARPLKWQAEGEKISYIVVDASPPASISREEEKSFHITFPHEKLR